MESLFIPLACVDVCPLYRSSTAALLTPTHDNFADGIDPPPPSFLAASIKYQLIRATTQSTVDDEAYRPLQILWTENSAEPSSIRSGALYLAAVRGQHTAEKNEPVIFLHTEDPAIFPAWPCICTGYVISAGYTELTAWQPSNRVGVTESTIIQVRSVNNNSLSHFTGERKEPTPVDRLLDEEVLASQNPEAVEELTWRMKTLASKYVWVGSTPDGLTRRNQNLARREIIRSRLTFWLNTKTDSLPRSGDRVERLSGNRSLPTSFFEDRSLLVHSPEHGAGKTVLVEAIARAKLQCDCIHIIRPGALLAKFGMHADSALECIVHQIALSAAFRREMVCIILDHLDAFLPPAFSGATALGDAALPCLNAIASYLKKLTCSLTYQNEIPFPSKTPLYNWQGRYGYALPIRICLIAVVTCPDDGWRRTIGSSDSTILDALVAGRYRLPGLTAKSRFSALCRAFHKSGIPIPPDLESRLAALAASAVWARGGDFLRIARLVGARLDASAHSGATIAIVESVMVSMRSLGSKGSQVQFLAGDDVDESDFTTSIGGNQEAKQALAEALALNPQKRKILSSFGVSPPTGILLYGPPGTGKTMLAKAVARLLRTHHSSAASIGGAFISLSSTDIVCSEVGSGEKIILAAFETAKNNSPAVVFIDEFQALFIERSNGGSGRLSSTLLQCMDDATKWKTLDQEVDSDDSVTTTDNHHVVVLAATNAPWMVDRAFLRPGRFDRAIFVGLPTPEERTQILGILIGKMQTDFAKDSVLSDVCSRIADQTEGFSGADLSALCRAAAVRCLAENAGFVRYMHFTDALKDGMQPSSDRNLVQRLSMWRP